MKTAYELKADAAINEFLDTTSPAEISNTLALMLEVYIQHAEVSKTDLANTASFVNQLNTFFFNLDRLRFEAWSLKQSLS